MTQDAEPALYSMTGFASQTGAFGAFRWTWDLRGVNGKGLDLRLRVPEWVDGLEAALRPIVSKVAKRGNVTLSLRLAREDASAELNLNRAQLDAAVDALTQIEAAAMARGLDLAPSRASDIAAIRGVIDFAASQEDPGPLRAALIADVPKLLEAFSLMRRNEGAALADVIAAQLNAVADLTHQAAKLAADRKHEMAQTLKQNLARVLDADDRADPDRVAQELALLAVKADVTEEIDRLHAHVAAARALLAEGGAVGRKLDFLMQEFNREANTLCSKSQNKALTAVGLDLKALIDQMREQVQNLE